MLGRKGSVKKKNVVDTPREDGGYKVAKEVKASDLVGDIRMQELWKQLYNPLPLVWHLMMIMIVGHKTTVFFLIEVLSIRNIFVMCKVIV